MSAEEKSKTPILKLIVLAIVVIGLFAAMKFLPVTEWLRTFNDWVSHMGVAGIFIFIGVYVAATVLLAPGLILTIGAGFAFGLWKGFLAVSSAATIGAALAFLVARFIARDKVEAMAKGSEKFRKIDSAVGRQGAMLIFLLRLSPVIPFNLSNYLYGLTSVKFWPYVLASWIGMMPGTLLYVYLGTIGKVGLEASKGGGAGRSLLQYVFLGVGLIATIAVTVIVTRIAKRALKEKTE